MESVYQRLAIALQLQDPLCYEDLDYTCIYLPRSKQLEQLAVRLTCISILLELGHDPTVNNSHCLVALLGHRRVPEVSAETVRLLLKAVADPSTNLSLMLALLEDPRVDPDDPDSDCCTALDYAAVQYHVRLTRAILAREEAWPNYADDTDDELTPIESACGWISTCNAKTREDMLCLSYYMQCITIASAQKYSRTRPLWYRLCATS